MTIVAAIDMTNDAEQVLTTAHDLANAYSEPLVVVYVMSEENYEDQRRDLTQRDDEAEYPIQQAEDESANEVEELVDELFEQPSVEIIPVGRVGSPKNEVLQEGRNRDARYLVIGGRKRTPTGKAIFGSTTQSILLGADRPVVTVME